MVYVDDSNIKFGRMKMSHMIADTLPELHAMADKIGLPRKHFQNHPRHPHYDVCSSKKAAALSYGATLADRRTIAKILKTLRGEK